MKHLPLFIAILGLITITIFFIRYWIQRIRDKKEGTRPIDARSSDILVTTLYVLMIALFFLIKKYLLIFAIDKYMKDIFDLIYKTAPISISILYILFWIWKIHQNKLEIKKLDQKSLQFITILSTVIYASLMICWAISRIIAWIMK